MTPYIMLLVALIVAFTIIKKVTSCIIRIIVVLVMLALLSAAYLMLS